MTTESKTRMQTIVVVDDEPSVAEGVAVGLAREGRRIIVCRDIECARLVIENEKVDAIVADIQFRGEFSFDGLDFVDTLKKLAPDVDIYLMTGAGFGGLEKEALKRGAAGFFQKPFSVNDLDDVLPSPPEGSREEEKVSVPELDEIIEESLIHARFQPIVHLATREHVGLEALARPVTDSLFRNPELLFRYASRSERTIELECHCLRNSIRVASSLHAKKRLFLNVHPASLEKSAIIRAIEQGLAETNLEPSRLVLEITEHGSITSPRSLDQIRSLKALGMEFAIDDIGTAFSHLPYIEQIEPSWMKISQYFGTGFERDETKGKIVRNIASLASSFEANFILEGIETEETAEAASELGIEYGQGYLFARPAEIDTFEYV
ncbi:MAG: EAL domain-containing response regulator [Thermoanaerobaculia bacterium]|nr:EAL domain-containing response regulator [Thermoanaerobaculia bacterium]